MSRQQQQTQQQETQTPAQIEQLQKQDAQQQTQTQTQLQPPPPPPLLPSQAPAQQQGTQDRDTGKKWKDCEDKLLKLCDELAKAKKDLERARAKEEPTGYIYAEIHRIEDAIRYTEKECEKHKPVVDNPKIPDLSVAQNIISTSVVRRKDDKALPPYNVVN